jgi:ABC-2 type transport system ATP-binding protein
MRDRARVVASAIEDLGLGDRREQLAGELSGGWKQRLALAACLLHRPKLLLLEEPTAGVDPKARRDFWEEIYRLAAQGISVLVSTHYMDEAERCHRLAYISAGTLLTMGTAAEVIDEQHLAAWSVSGPDLVAIVDRLRGKPGVEHITPFGATLHVTGRDAAVLEQSIRSLALGPGHHAERIDAGLEDVFISLMARAPEEAVR